MGSGSLFLKGVALLNAFLAPIAGAGLYLAYLGRSSGDGRLLTVGVALTLASPLLAYLAAAPLASRLSRRASSDEPMHEKS